MQSELAERPAALRQYAMCLGPLPIEQFGPLCDATLQSFAWVQGDPDMPPPLVLTLRLGDGSVRAYTFTWVSHLEIPLVQKDRGPCQPFSWEGNARRLDDERIAVAIDFASQGAIVFQCQEISVAGT